VISYTDNWGYVAFAALGSWIGAFLALTFMQPGRVRGPVGSAADQAGSAGAP
jgi:hypothetical protein